MKRSKQEIERLARVTEAAFQLAQAALRRKAEAEARLQSELDQLRAGRRTVIATLQVTEERSAAQVACHGAWLTWADQRRARLNMALARARAAALKEREAARLAFGRDRVAQELLRKARLDGKG